MRGIFAKGLEWGSIVIINKTFRYRLEPNSTQQNEFKRFAGSSRFMYNYGLAARKAFYEENGKTLSYFEQTKLLPSIKNVEQTKWLKEIHSQVLQQALKDLDSAYQHFFRRVKTGEVPGFPRFKKKGKKDSFRYSQHVKVKDSKVYLPKIGWVAYRDSRPIEGKILQATVKREGKHWFISLACEVRLPDPAPVAVTESGAVGIDVGIKSFAVLSDGTEIENTRFLGKSLGRLKKAQRRLSKKVKGSNRWRKQVEKVVKVHIQIKNSRKDFAHKVSTAIVKNHDVIAVEDLDIKGMVKNRHLSRAISDVGWGLFMTMLKYKAEWAGKHFVKIDRYFPSTKMCSRCGKIREISLDERTYSCDNCSLIIDRDYNAALNIRSAGLVVLGCKPQNACGGA